MTVRLHRLLAGACSLAYVYRLLIAILPLCTRTKDIYISIYHPFAYLSLFYIKQGKNKMKRKRYSHFIA